jgi:murein DD-endopeptidase MepM/ murein hydrolase activator NlpD
MMLAVIAATWASSSSGAEVHGDAAQRAPVVEVVAFGVAPVAGVPDDAHLRPRDGDVLHRIDAFGTRAEARGEVEVRSLAAENWAELLERVAPRLGGSLTAGLVATAQLHLLPHLAGGKYVRVRAVPDKPVLQIDYVVRAEEVYSIVLAASGVQVSRNGTDPRVVERMRGDAAKASLFTATDAIGLPEIIALQLADIFSDNVDFHRELHLGYRCVLVYEMRYRDGYIEGPGRILAAEIEIRNRRLQAFYYQDGNTSGYFTETGASLKRLFRRSPVEFSRVTSDYTLARFHPVLGRWRAHRGADYAAPVGTRVLATAPGTVEFMGTRGEYGKLLILNHFDKFHTYYGHLDGYARNLAPGHRVEKGDVVGFVGMTGLATGPHLHYEFRVDNGSGQWLSVPPPDVVETPPLKHEAYFRAVRAYQGQFQVAQRTHRVVLD